MTQTTTRPAGAKAAPTVFDRSMLDAGHLLRRAGFGATPKEVADAAKAGIQTTVNRLVDYEQTPDNFVPPDDSIIPLGLMGVRGVNDLSAWWLTRMLTTSRPLQEKMSLFWHGHFATAVQKVRSPLFMYQQNQLFRTQALGRFDDLLSAVYKDPAMLIWLDGRRNTAKAPNENFGREVMELFTLGRGNYSEDDVHANARCFTGWTLRQDGTVQFAPRLHDGGVKTLLGQTGNFDGEDAVRILAAHPATGPFLAGRLWRFFGSDSPPSGAVQKMADAYYRSNHSIKEMVSTMLSLPDFYSAATRNGHIKSPTEFVTTAVRQLGLQNVDVSRWPVLLTTLGQQLFNPPNVGGWPAGVSWINAGTLLGRFNFASMLTGDVSRGATPINVDGIAGDSGAATMEDLVPYIGSLLGLSMSVSTRSALLQYSGKGSVDGPDLETRVRGLIHLALMSPEYQVS